MNFSTLVIAFLLDYQVSLFGLEKTALVVLGAVLAVVELVHHLVVLLGKVRFGSLGEGFADSGIISEASNFTGHSLQALLALKNSHVHVLYPLDHVGHWALITSDSSPFSLAADSNLCH